MPSNSSHFVSRIHRGRVAAPDVNFSRCFGMALAILLILLTLEAPVWVQAQVEGALVVQAQDTTDFPQISVQFTLPDSLDRSGDELIASQVQVLEDGWEAPITSLEVDRRGVHFTLAINGGRDFDLRDPSGSSKYEKIRDVLQGWVLSSPPSQGDAWSLITNDGMNLVHSTEVGPWLEALIAYAPDFRVMTPNLESLSAAVQSAADRMVPFGVDKSILYLTTVPGADEINRVQELAEQARSAGIQVNVWMIGDPIFLDNDQGGALISLAERTGGNFYQFFGTESLPDPENFLSSLGFVYILQYESQIRQTGAFPLQVQVDRMGSIFQGESSPFYVDVQHPKVVLFNPPTTLHRKIFEEGKTTGALVSENLQTVFYPDLQPVEFYVNFPDGIPREIVATRLYVNGVVAAVKEKAPFNLIIWDLSEVIEPEEILLQVEVTDSLGLTGRSAEFPVQVFVDFPQADPQPTLRQMTLLLSGIIVGLGFLALLAWLIFWLIRKANHKQLQGVLARVARKRAYSTGSSPKDPEIVFATLIPTGCLDEDWEARAIRITQQDGVFGRQEGRADYLLEDEGVDQRQARMMLDDEGIWLQDLDSSLGTWVNYEGVGSKPVKVHPGDVIHFGDCGFRFTMVNNTLPERVRCIPYEPIL